MFSKYLNVLPYVVRPHHVATAPSEGPQSDAPGFPCPAMMTGSLSAPGMSALRVEFASNWLRDPDSSLPTPTQS